MCEVGLECTGPGTAECDAVHRSFDDLLFGDRNENCADIWLVFEFHDCRANLGCEDREMATGSFPGTPCYEEAIAAYDAGCML
jgi:hypothetical protein